MTLMKKMLDPDQHRIEGFKSPLDGRQKHYQRGISNEAEVFFKCLCYPLGGQFFGPFGQGCRRREIFQLTI